VAAWQRVVKAWRRVLARTVGKDRVHQAVDWLRGAAAWCSRWLGLTLTGQVDDLTEDLLRDSLFVLGRASEFLGAVLDDDAPKKPLTVAQWFNSGWGSPSPVRPVTPSKSAASRGGKPSEPQPQPTAVVQEQQRRAAAGNRTVQWWDFGLSSPKRPGNSKAASAVAAKPRTIVLEQSPPPSIIRKPSDDSPQRVKAPGGGGFLEWLHSL
jgi:hypothetical protein